MRDKQTLTLRAVQDEDDVLLIDSARTAAGLERSFSATHVFERDGKTVGFASVNAIPVLTGWLHDDRVSQEEGMRAIAELEEHARSQGLRFLVMPCTDDCRFLPDMAKMGFRRTERVTLFIKPLRKD